MGDAISRLRDRLVSEGQAALSAPPKAVEFTKDPEADQLLNDIDGHPHAFVCASLVDRQVPAETAWLVPSKIRARVGSFEFADLKPLTEEDWLRLMHEPEPAHRFPDVMARVLHRAIQRIASSYGGLASRIWADQPSSATIVRRFLEFHGAGPKIATMASNILVRDLHIRLRDYRYIDISADVQVCRVMGRLGLAEEGARPEVIVYVARDLNPDFPGIFDLALWDIGRTVCRPQNPQCPKCPLRDLCAYAQRAASQ